MDLITCPTSLIYDSILIEINYVESFMHTALKSHFSETSNVAAHSFLHLFGAAPNPISTGEHTHNCADCDRVRLLIKYIEAAVESISEERLALGYLKLSGPHFM